MIKSDSKNWLIFPRDCSYNKLHKLLQCDHRDIFIIYNDRISATLSYPCGALLWSYN